MTTDMFHLSLAVPGHFLVHDLSYIGEEQTTQWPKEKVQKDKQ
jgi:hypothetical protein